jgi:hypothetical protein
MGLPTKVGTTYYNSVGVSYLRFCRPPVIAQNSRYDRSPQAANGWGTIYPIPDIAPSLRAENEEPPT